MDLDDKYRKNAEEAQRWADRASIDEDKVKWLNLGKGWLRSFENVRQSIESALKKPNKPSAPSKSGQKVLTEIIRGSPAVVVYTPGPSLGWVEVTKPHPSG